MRSKPAPKRTVSADPFYNHPLVAKTINRLMKDGKKSVAQKQFYIAMNLLKEKTGQDPLQAFLTAIDNIRPQMEVRARRIGGAAYQVPTAVRAERRDSLAIRWLITAARARSNSEFHSFGAKLAAELIDATANNGGAMKKKLDTHRMAEANKAFAHFRW
jgi:small subunit ribosomal protein S7